jgi:uncharacterized phage protein (TIGR02216 family)
MAMGLGVLGLSPAVFWSLTVKELEAALRGRLGNAPHAEPLRRSDFDALMHTFPDL